MLKIFSQDDKDIDEEVRNSSSEPIECKACGKKFIPKGRNRTRQKICRRQHYAFCSHCGKKILIDHNKTADFVRMNKESLGCCKTCSNHLRIDNNHKTLQERYGVSNPSQIPGNRIKALNTIYSKNLRESMSEHSRQTWKNKDETEIQDIVSKRQQTCLDRYGVDNPSKLESIKKKISYISSSEEVLEKRYKTNIGRYGCKHVAQSQYLINRRSGKYNISDDIHLDSGYELIFYNFLRRVGFENSDIERNCRLEYIGDDSKTHYTFIDFKVDDILFEVKGGYYLETLINKDTCKLQAYKDNDVKIITDLKNKDLFDHPTLCGKVPKGSFTGIDIKIFDNPYFPARDDRPIEFYQTPVSGRISCYDAFYDDEIKWKMLLNRLMYRGGFIEVKDIVRALNITKYAKSPSWFSKPFARKLIQSYCTSDVIVDPFAGWGTRHDAAVELGKIYIGIDANEPVVEFHRKHGRDNILFDDIENFYFNEKCSVFTCPPYADKEVYFKDMKIKNTSKWVDIVLQHIPNASEYVFVCDEVEEDKKKYIVNEKDNTNHFGKSSELILVIPGNEIKNRDKVQIVNSDNEHQEINSSEDILWIHNGSERKQVKKSSIYSYLSQGWKTGTGISHVKDIDKSNFHGQSGKIRMNNPETKEEVFVSNEDMQSYLEKGFIVGMSKSTKEKISTSHRKQLIS